MSMLLPFCPFLALSQRELPSSREVRIGLDVIVCQLNVSRVMIPYRTADLPPTELQAAGTDLGRSRQLHQGGRAKLGKSQRK